MAIYDERFCVESRLFDGTEVRIRSVHPEDAPLLRAGFAHLSPRTRYLRFFAHKGMGMGVARYSELDGSSDGGNGREAEAAVVVVDAFQGRGIGRLLLGHLAGAARERGIRKLRFTALLENAPMAALLRRVFGEESIRARRDEGPVIHWIVDLQADREDARSPDEIIASRGA